MVNLETVISWFHTNFEGILFIASLIILSISFNRLSKSESYKKFLIESKPILTKIKTTAGKFLAFAFFITLIASIFLHILQPEIFPNFISNLAISALALGAFTVAMANLVNNTKIEQEAMRYRHLAEDFISSGVYFIFSYFFWIVVVYNEKNTSNIIESIVSVYSVLTVIALIGAIILMISGMWKLVNRN